MDIAAPVAAPFALVVEDNSVLLLHAADILTDAGFSVFAASSTDEALEWLGKHGSHIVLLFTNVDLPGLMDGFELARFVAGNWPKMAILVASGRFEAGDGIMPPGSVFLPKPYQSKDVISLTRGLIETKQPFLYEAGLLAFDID